MAKKIHVVKQFIARVGVASLTPSRPRARLADGGAVL